MRSIYVLFLAIGASALHAAEAEDPIPGLKQRAERQFQKADRDRNGALSREEMQAHMPRTAERFDELDADKSGGVTRDELRAYAKTHRHKMAAEMQRHFDERFRESDRNGDGALDKLELQAGMPRFAKHWDDVDADRDGKATKEELRQHVAKMRRPPPAPPAPKANKPAPSQDSIEPSKR
jgi:transposase